MYHILLAREILTENCVILCTEYLVDPARNRQSKQSRKSKKITVQKSAQNKIEKYQLTLSKFVSQTLTSLSVPLDTNIPESNGYHWTVSTEPRCRKSLSMATLHTTG